MKVLVIGQGGREHAIIHALKNTNSKPEVHALPGSDGIAEIAKCHAIPTADFSAIIDLCHKENFSYVFIGPEDPLVQGLADVLRAQKIAAIGPDKNAAQLEGSKVYAKEFMRAAGIPTAPFSVVRSVAETLKQASLFTPPYVLKADGLAAGKGVFICKTLHELESAAAALFVEKIFGQAGERAILEQFTTGSELSYLLLTNGEDFQVLPIAQDHKRLLDEDQGPNTGGMGTVAPLAISQKLRTQIDQQIVRPTLMLLQKRGFTYRGVLFLGLMINEQGPSLLEFNCRFGDPETQVILPLIENDLNSVFSDLSRGQLQNLHHKKSAAACVILAAPGYPNNPEKGLPIRGSLQAAENSYFLHAGSRRQGPEWVTAGGRVLCAVGLGATIEQACHRAYQLSEQVTWNGLQKRSDIGQRLTSSSVGSGG